jgi:tetratricopeptide (TPR) repeat protein
VVQAGAYISKSGCGLVRYLEMYKERRTGILEEYQGHVQKIDNYEQTVYTTWTVNFEKMSPRAATFLNICSFFHHDGIPIQLFQNAAAIIETRTLEASNGLETATEFLSSFRSAEGHWDHPEFLALVSEIRSYSLIDFDERNETYSIHPLVHDWTRRRVSDSTSVHECSQIILSISIDGGDGSKDIAFRRTLLPHIDVSLRSGTSKDPGVAALLWYPYNEGGRWREAEEMMKVVVEMRKKPLGDDHPDTLQSMNNLGSTYSRQGRWREAEELGVRVMETKKRVLGEDHLDTLESMNNLTITYSRQGRWNEAEEIGVRVMETRKRVLGDDHPETLSSMGNLSTMYSRQGRWNEAEQLQMRVMETRKRILGEDHPDTLASMGNLGWIYSSQGRRKEAEELEVRVMEMMKRVLGEEHPDTLRCMTNLGWTYSNQGRRIEAEELLARVVETSKKVLGDDHPETLARVAKLASIAGNRGTQNRVKKIAKWLMRPHRKT